jgi:hypothetical protein
MSDLTWGVPTQRKKKTEKFNTPVLAMSKLEGKGSGRKFSFNKAAQEALGIDSEEEQSVMIGFPKGEDNNTVFVKVVNGEVETGYKLTKSATFSNKKIFEFITNRKELSNDVENELHLEDNDKVAEAFEITTITTENDEVESEDSQMTQEENTEAAENTEKVAEEKNDTVENDVEEDTATESKEESKEESSEETW